METSAFDFDLPAEQIAQQPAEPRDSSRLLVLHRALSDSGLEHRRFYELPRFLAPGDVLVRNNTQVVAARLIGVREQTGGGWEGLFLRELEGGDWSILATTRGKPRLGETIMVGDGLRLVLIEKGERGHWRVRPLTDGRQATTAVLAKYGQVPLPPYIRKGEASPGDRLRYQTLYAERPGAVAAPTAGLHFTDAVFKQLHERGVMVVDLTLHVGIGTFRPIETERIDDHVLHAEWGELSEPTADLLRTRRQQGGKIIAVGTTSARVLETSTLQTGEFTPFAGETALYLRPGHKFRGVDGLITNFHLPRSSLLVLVSAFAGYDRMKQAYQEAIHRNYRFYSYGDAMLIL